MRQMIFMALLLTFLFGCARSGMGDEPPRQETLLGITISDAATTKSLDKDWGDDAIDIVDIYVFNEDGTADVSGEFTAEEDIMLKCTRGAKNIYAVVNKRCDPTMQIENISDIEALTSTLTDNAEGRFVMAGVATATVTGKEMDVSMEVSRLASKVSLLSVTNGMEESAWKDKELVIKAIYLINVPVGPESLFGEAETEEWANKLAAEDDTGCDDFLRDELDCPLQAGETYSGEHTFYAYPNHMESDAYGGGWSPRKTRLVVEVEIGGRTCHYPITFGDGLESNRQYVINNLTIKRMGSAIPDNPVTSMMASFDAIVTNWDIMTLDKTEL